MYRWVNSSSCREPGVQPLASEARSSNRPSSPQRYLAFDLLLDEMILALVIEDNVDLLGGVAADVGACNKLTRLLQERLLVERFVLRVRRSSASHQT